MYSADSDADACNVARVSCNVLSKLFNCMMAIGRVPTSFGQSYTVPISGASTNGGLGDGSPTISKMGGFATKVLNHHFVRRPLFPLLGLFTSVYAPTSIPPTVPESDIMVIDNKNL